MTDNTNPGNFANRPKEEVQEIASKGGQASKGGFASMDPDKQVCIYSFCSKQFFYDALSLIYINRKRLLPRGAKLRADLLSQVARRQRKLVARVDLLLE